MLRLARRSPKVLFILRRTYHDDATFGFRVPAKYDLPDYTQRELDNRNINAPLLRYVEMVRRHGHRAARIDPLDLMERDPVDALDAKRYGLTDDSASFPLQGIMHLPSASPEGTHGERTEVGEGTESALQLKEIKDHLFRTYVDRIGYEFQHCPVKSERLWFSHQLETEASSFPVPFPKERQKRVHKLLVRSEEMDRFLGKKFPNLKRYGCEGAESMLPALDTLFELGAKAGISSIVVALPHRGRLSLLTDPDLLAYPPAALFSKIRGKAEFNRDIAPGATGDVISHIGAVREIPYDGRSIEVEIIQNSSHLEAINPVALGYTRAKQMGLLKSSPGECKLGDKVLCVQLHGDAAFAGQGVVAESLGLSGLPHYGSGGTVHIIVNNNIGYTTPASFARSSIYSSDIGKMIGSPILHVNGDYPEAVVRAVDIAFRYRHMFRKDVIIDLICYRRWGHNELDEPAYTQPRMYEKIRARSSVPFLYEDRLTVSQIESEMVLKMKKSSGVMSPSEAKAVRDGYNNRLEDEFNSASEYEPPPEEALAKWHGLEWPASSEIVHDPATGVEEARLKGVAKASVAVPDDFNLHPRLKRHISARLKSLETKVDFATAEAMAFGTLLQDGKDVRISGQDVGRGTFSQRHAMLVDQKSEDCLVPLNDSLRAKGKLELANSSLSEMAVLGFEVGISWASPELLPIWEAQFGDFNNGAQIIIDAFVVGAQAKWLRQSGLVMMLPHGYDGAGPEHSSARIERFLQLSDDRGTDVNLIVANPSTPAQMYHLLRRQMARNYRKPLVIASPKGLLRSPVAASPLSDMGPGTRFQPVIEDEPASGRDNAERILLVSGKHYYTLSDHISKTERNDIALIRIEELSPFPYTILAKVLQQYHPKEEKKVGKQGLKVVWAQEEPENQGAWSHVKPRIERVLGQLGLDEEKILYAGRKAGATTATGVGDEHKAQASEIIDLAFKV